jgi:hypothetical protein
LVTEDPEAPLGFDQFNTYVRGPWHSCVKVAGNVVNFDVKAMKLVHKRKLLAGFFEKIDEVLPGCQFPI